MLELCGPGRGMNNFSPKNVNSLLYNISLFTLVKICTVYYCKIFHGVGVRVGGVQGLCICAHMYIYIYRYICM